MLTHAGRAVCSRTLIVTALMLSAVFLVLGGQAQCATLNVGPGETYTTIQSAITAAATTGDTIQVAAGTYVERIDFIGKAITVRSTDPTNPAVVAATIIDGGAGGSVVTFNHAEGVGSVITGFTIRNGNTGDSGGGIYCWGSSPAIIDNAISGNTATWGGGVYCSMYSFPTITGNTISGNTAGKHGGGIYCCFSSPTIAGNAISGNTAAEQGGGIYCDYSSPPITANTISGNTATSGGGIHCNHSAPAITGNTISGNTATSGGGICCYGTQSSPTVRNTIVAFSTNGGGIYRPTGSPAFSYCDVYGNAGGNYVGPFFDDQTGINGNISVDPLFASAASGDFHLKARGGRWTTGGWVTDAVHSPCIDAGDSGAAFANEPAPNGGRINMGAFGNTGQASKWANSPPTVATATVTPATPGMNDSLHCEASSSTDADSDPVTYSYQWYKDGVSQQGRIYPTLAAQWTRRGQVWRCVVTPNDGIEDGPTGEDAVTVNSPPTAPTVVITPGDPSDGDSFRATASGSVDADGDSVSYSYQWYKNSVLQVGVTWQRIGANRTRLGQVWRCVVTPSDGADDGPTGEASVTISNSAPTAPTVTITPSNPGTDDSFRCVGSDSIDADGDPVTYSYQWYKNGVLQPGLTWQRIGASRTRRGQTWKCVVTPNDGTDDGPSGEDEVTIGNSAPTAPTVAITPGNPRTDDSFRCVGSDSTDADGDSVGYSYQWYKNGVLQPGLTWQRIGASRTRRGQTWKCVVTPTDGTEDGPTNEASVTIGNTAPTAPIVVITPGDPTSADSFRCNASGSTDPDGDEVEYRYQWYKNGVRQPGLIWQRIGAIRTRRGQTWRCVVTPSDLHGEGTPGEASVTIGNSAPTAPTVVIAPGSPTSADSFRVTASGSTDADGDSVRYSYQWFKNGVLQPNVTWQTIGASRTREGQVWRCVVTPSDTHGDGATGEATVTIGGGGAALTVSSLAATPTAAGAELSFTLSAEAAVTCEVLNIAGRAVRTIVADRPMAEGINSLAWDGRNAAGLRAPAGVYLVRMTATASSGARWTSMGTLNLTR